MLEYEGQPCFYCGVKFEADDDIVTCPECGTPYHRACWRETGRCTNAALHAANESWLSQQRAEQAKTRSAEKAAEIRAEEDARARGEAPKRINASLYDGVRLNPNDPCIGLDPAEPLDGDTNVQEMAAFVASNRFYYLPLFRLMKTTGRKLSMNFICLFCPHLYFANRRMWGLGIFSMLLNMLLSLPADLLYLERVQGEALSFVDTSSAAFDRLSALCSFGGLVISVLWCLLANFLYYRFAQRRIRRVRRSAAAAAAPEGAVQPDQVLLSRLTEAGGTRSVNILLMLALQVAISFVGVYFMWYGF